MLLAAALTHMISAMNDRAEANDLHVVRVRPQGRAPRGFENWDAAGVWRDDEGLAAPSADEIKRLRLERTREKERMKRRAKSKENAMERIRAEGTRILATGPSQGGPKRPRPRLTDLVGLLDDPLAVQRAARKSARTAQAVEDGDVE